MAIVEVNQPVPLVGQVPVVLGIALGDDDRRRLAAALDGAGVLVFAPDLVTAGAVLDRHAAVVAEPSTRPAEPVVRRGGLEVDPARCRARWRDTPLALTQRERALLACLAAEPARVWSYRQLYAAAWPGGYLDPGPVHAAVKRLRRKLRAVGAAVRIEAVRGVGYELAETDGYQTS
ncbi:MAG: transcriptional regulator [Micromonosporaceae bacterium]|nr:transcriptional regulator [Micromonosporaceae bacterium]